MLKLSASGRGGALALNVHLQAGKISICWRRAQGKLAAQATRQELPALLLWRSSFLGFATRAGSRQMEASKAASDRIVMAQHK